MRPLALIGIVLLLLGAYVTFRGFNYSSKEEVLQVGDVKATVESKKAVPTWVGGIAIVAGVVLIAAGMRRRA
jgi:UDP-N-acetylmuramyl pentapeptide phosphotransferase/UDP-N-acetylglucosamine-1-phosphate transferase